MPCVAALIREAPIWVDGLKDVEHERLWMPSSLTLLQQSEGCKSSVDLIEEQLREAQCLDALDTIRGIARSQRASWAYRDANMQGQVHMTHAASFMECLQRRLDSAVTKYRAALLGLQGTGDWEKTL